MWIEGKVSKVAGSRWWEISVPALAVFTQGTSRKDAFAMLKDAIGLLAADQMPGLAVDVVPGDGETIFVGGADTKALFGFLLRRQRQISGIGIQRAAAAMGSKYANAYAAYEQGKREPTLSMATTLLAAANPAGAGAAIHFNKPRRGKTRRGASRAAV